MVASVRAGVELSRLLEVLIFRVFRRCDAEIHSVTRKVTPLSVEVRAAQ